MTSAMTEATTTLSVSFECLSAKIITFLSEVELLLCRQYSLRFKEYLAVEKYDISQPVCLQTLRYSCQVVSSNRGTRRWHRFVF